MKLAPLPLFAASLFLTLLAAAEIDFAPHLIWNASTSVPIGLYLVRPSSSLSLGELAAVRLPEDMANWVAEREYLSAEALLLKRVAAASGMTVCRYNFHVTVNGILDGKAARLDRKRRPLPCWAGCVTLGPTVVFLFLFIAHAPDSLDGRYFGTMQKDLIVGTATPLWTRGGPGNG